MYVKICRGNMDIFVKSVEVTQIYMKSVEITKKLEMYVNSVEIKKSM